ncbi:MAG TPA: tRNA lysidine(34) synthetase TilS [Terriglobia bacterium]
MGVAVSGGPDSILLLDFMAQLARDVGLTLAVVHFNHHLRGEESDADEHFVSERARLLGLEFLCSGAPVAGVARARKRNLEATARELRYRFFFSLVRHGKLDKVATAHTANDQTETVLLRLLRGTGTRGLGGIHPALEGGVVRPFLSLTRAEVQAEVARRKLAFRVDSTNQDTRFHRNRVRQQVLPLLEREFNPSLIRSLAAFADRARDDESFLEDQAWQRSRPWLVREVGRLKIPNRRLDEFPPAIARRVLRRMLVEAYQEASSLAGRTSGALGLTYQQIESLRRLAHEGQSGSRLLLAGGVMEAVKEFEWLVVGQTSGPTRGASREGFAHRIQPPAEVVIPELGVRLRFRLADLPDAKLPEQAYTATSEVWLEAGEIAAPLTLRSWRPGDRICLAGRARAVKLKQLFQRRRVPLDQRRYWPVLESARGIIWARGFEGRRTSAATESCRHSVIVVEERAEEGLQRKPPTQRKP